MTHLFKSISLDKLDNAAYFLFVKLIHDKAADSKMLTAKARRFVDALGEGVKLVDESLKLSRKSDYTDELRTLEQQRMAVLKTMKSAVNGITEFPNENKDVKAMLQLFKDYAITGKLKLDQKTSLIINLITDMEGKNAAQTKALNLGSHVERLKEANNRYLALREERTSESITKGVGSMRAARKKCNEAYRELLEVVNSLVLLEGETEYQDFIDYLNAQIVHYKREALSQKASAELPKGGDGAGGENTGGGSTGGGDDGLQ